MANHYTAKRIQLTVGCALVALLGCGGEDASSSDDLSSAALDISDTTNSLATAEAQSSECFAEFRACKQAVGGDAKACSDTLKSCLPEQAPRSRRCEAGDGGRDRDDDRDEDADEDTDEKADETASPDGGIRQKRDKSRPGDSVDGGVDHHDGKQGHGHKQHGCGRPDISANRFRACTATSTGSMLQGTDPAAAAGAHKQCVQKAFSERLESLCDRAEKLCKRADADGSACVEIAAACAKATAP